MKLILFIFYCILPLTSHARDYSDRYAIGAETYDPITFNELIEMIEVLPNKSVENLLPKLKEREPMMFHDYLLIYRSRSLQSASFVFPRTILTGKDAKLMLAYNGHPRQKGFHNLEVISFDDQKKNFTFHEISFLNGDYTVSEPNPQKCLNCHQSSTRTNSDPRPNWEPYNVWPGTYGSVGHISKVNDHRYKDSPRYVPLLGDLLSQEETRLDYFIRNIQDTHPRYQFLEKMEQYGVHLEYLSPPVNQALPNNMPTRITHAINHLNLQRVARLMKATPIFEFYKEAFIGAIRCEHYYMPTELYQWHRRNYLRQKEHQFDAMYISQSDSYSHPAINSPAEAISLIFEPHGIDTSDWSTDFGTQGLFASENRFGGPNNPRQEMGAAFLKVFDSKEKQLFKKTCKELKEISLKKLSLFWQQHKSSLPEQKPATAQTLLNRCQKCHSNANYDFTAPYIPFDNPTRLGTILHQGTYKHGTLFEEIVYRLGPHATFTERMPADGNMPSQQEQEVFINYLKTL